jgi:hypothetical protein
VPQERNAEERGKVLHAEDLRDQRIDSGIGLSQVSPIAAANAQMVASLSGSMTNAAIATARIA